MQTKNQDLPQNILLLPPLLNPSQLLWVLLTHPTQTQILGLLSSSWRPWTFLPRDPGHVCPCVCQPLPTEQPNSSRAGSLASLRAAPLLGPSSPCGLGREAAGMVSLLSWGTPSRHKQIWCLLGATSWWLVPSWCRQKQSTALPSSMLKPTGGHGLSC